MHKCRGFAESPLRGPTDPTSFDVDGSGMITVHLTPARARVPPFAKLFLLNGPTLRADLAGVFGINESHCSTSILSFVLTELDESMPTSIEYALIQACLSCCSIGQVFPSGFILLGLRSLGHVSRCEPLEHNGTKSLYEAV